MDLDVQPKRHVIVIDDDDDGDETEDDVEMQAAIAATEQRGGVLVRRMTGDHRNTLHSVCYIEPRALTRETMTVDELLRSSHVPSEQDRVGAVLRKLVSQGKARVFQPQDLPLETFTGRVQYDLRYDARGMEREDDHKQEILDCKDRVVWHVFTDDGREETYLIPLDKFRDRSTMIGSDNRRGLLMGTPLPYFLKAVWRNLEHDLSTYRIAARQMADIEGSEDDPLMLEQADDEDSAVLHHPKMVVFSFGVKTQSDE